MKRRHLPSDTSVVSSTAESKKRRCDELLPPSKPTEYTDLFAYFRTLPHDSDFDNLFKNPVVVLALFRSLDDIERIIVIRILSLPEASRWEPFLFWLRGNRKEAIRALNSLRSLHLLLIKPQRQQQSSSTRLISSTSVISQQQHSSRPSEDGGSTTGSLLGVGGGSSSVAGGSFTSATSRNRLSSGGIAEVRYELHPVFRQTLQSRIWEDLDNSIGDGIPLLSSKVKAPKHFPTRSTLQNHATTQWNKILQWLCEGASAEGERNSDQTIDKLKGFYVRRSSPLEPPVSCDTVTVMNRLRLIRPISTSNKKEEAPSSRGGIPSPNGLQNETFQWLLLDIRSQILSICIEYLHCLHFDLIHTGPEVSPSSTSRSNRTPLMTAEMAVNTLLKSSMKAVSTEAAAKSRMEVLSFLLTLSEALIGQVSCLQPLPTSDLTPIQVRFLGLAYDIGLIWMHKPKGVEYCFPTPFAKLLQCDGAQVAHLTSAISTLAALGHQPGGDWTESSVVDLPSTLYHPAYTRFFAHEKLADYPVQLNELKDPSSRSHPTSETGVIVESNFKVFAYTASTLLITVVARLCEIRVITPNLVVGNLSRDSVLEAYKSGVTAEQIIRFFSVHSHPSIYTKSRREGKPVIPENVTTQLRIWEAERRRVRASSACVFEFSKESDMDVFPFAVAKASGTGWLLMNSKVPSSIYPSSKEFQEWKAEVIEESMERTAATIEFQKTNFPVLAIHARYKDEMTAFIRNSMKNLKRQ